MHSLWGCPTACTQHTLLFRIQSVVQAVGKQKIPSAASENTKIASAQDEALHFLKAAIDMAESRPREG